MCQGDNMTSPSKLSQRANVQFCYEQGKIATETYDLSKLYMEIIAWFKLLYKGDIQISGNMQEVTLQTTHALGHQNVPPQRIVFSQYGYLSQL